MLFDFHNFLYNNPLNDYLNSYSSFLLSKKYLKNNILHLRMNILINYYLNNNSKNKFDYYYYYLANFKDKSMDLPLLTFNPIPDDEFKGFDDDVIDHYKFIITKNPIEPLENYDEIDYKFYQEEYEKLKEIEENELEKSLELDYYDSFEEDYFDDDNFEDIDYNNYYDDYY